jgi:hypothetical protein
VQQAQFQQRAGKEPQTIRTKLFVPDTQTVVGFNKKINGKTAFM